MNHKRSCRNPNFKREKKINPASDHTRSSLFSMRIMSNARTMQRRHKSIEIDIIHDYFIFRKDRFKTTSRFSSETTVIESKEQTRYPRHWRLCSPKTQGTSNSNHQLFPRFGRLFRKTNETTGVNNASIPLPEWSPLPF